MKLKKRNECNKVKESILDKVTVDDFAKMYGKGAADALLKYSDAMKKSPEDVINGSDIDMTRFENWAKKVLKVDIYDNFGDYDYSKELDRVAKSSEIDDDEPKKLKLKKNRKVKEESIKQEGDEYEDEIEEMANSFGELVSKELGVPVEQCIDIIRTEIENGNVFNFEDALRSVKMKLKTINKLKKNRKLNEGNSSNKVIDQYSIYEFIEGKLLDCKWIEDTWTLDDSDPTIALTTIDGENFDIIIKKVDRPNMPKLHISDITPYEEAGNNASVKEILEKFVADNPLCEFVQSEGGNQFYIQLSGADWGDTEQIVSELQEIPELRGSDINWDSDDTNECYITIEI